MQDAPTTGAYELDGPVCDGRLVSITLDADGQKVTPVCDAGLQGDSWHFAERTDGSGSLDEKRITFSPQLCDRLGSAQQVKISIRGVENGCTSMDGTTMTPSCDPTK